MLRHIDFDLSLFSDENDRKNSQKRVLALLQALTYCNQLYLRANPNTPLIYQSGIVYKVPQQFEAADVPEISTIRQYLKANNAPDNVMAALAALHARTGGGEVFRDIYRIIENGGGDCDNVASWRSAELRELGIPARPYITWRKRADGGMTYHVIVRWPDGTSEDPSLLLGMGGEDRAADRAEEVRKLEERKADFIQGFRSSAPAKSVFGESPRIVHPLDGDMATVARYLSNRSALDDVPLMSRSRARRSAEPFALLSEAA